MKLEVIYCRRCSRSHAPGECGKRGSPAKASEGGGVQFPLADRDQVRSRVRVPAPEKDKPFSGGDFAGGGAPGSDSRERPAPTQVDALLKAYKAKEEHKRELKRKQMQRWRAKKAAQ